ncbi:DUF742 domain-containing protein [Actinocorallia longicatena]|uniref:DUF742 domain-containing protein n=1 Tax=Actinocorallia longicatena TaxID=111803 RepID=A0ABP6QLX7_9ACTN
MDHGGPSDTGDDSFLVRPYTITGGRTRPRSQVEIETVVSSVPYPPRSPSLLPPEMLSIYTLCQNWRSVAEVSALLRLPLGVARVLVADMAHEGLLRLHQSNPGDGPTDPRLLERVLNGLRKL